MAEEIIVPAVATVNETGAKPTVEIIKPAVGAPYLAVVPTVPPTNQYPVSIPIVAGAVAALLVEIVKDKWGVDFSNQEGHIIVVIMALALFFTHRKQ
jgi:hypothetical protein